MDRILLIRQLHSTQGENLPEAADAAGCGRGTAGKSADPEVFNPRERDLQGREPRPSGPDPCRPPRPSRTPRMRRAARTPGRARNHEDGRTVNG